MAILDGPWTGENSPMDYRYLGTTGVLNEAGPAAGWRGRPGYPPLPARSRAGNKTPIWRGKPIPRAVCELFPETLARGDLCFPVGEEGETLRVAAVDHDDVALA